MTPAEKRRAKLEERMAEMREQNLNGTLRKAPEPPTQRAMFSAQGGVKSAVADDPLAVGLNHGEATAPKKRGGQVGIEEGTSRKKELTFNAYLSQLEDPRSFVNLLPPEVREAVLTLPEDLVDKDEDHLLKLLQDKYNYQPTASAEALRTNFWMELDRVAATRNEVMNQGSVYLGICSRAYFHKVLHDYPAVLAYILCRPPEYEAVMRGMLSLSSRRIRDVLNIPLHKPTGELQDPKIIELVLKAAAMVDLRAKGGYIQRSETKNLTLMKQENSYTNVFQAASSQKAFDIAKIAENIDEKIALLEKEMAQVAGQALPEPPAPKGDVTAKEGEIVDAEFKEQF